MGRDSPKSSDKPRRSAKPRRAEDARHARRYLEQITWLRGAPEDGRWRRFDTDELIAIDGAQISKARRAGRTVLREHPLGLRVMIDDIDRWWAATDAKLGWLSAIAAGNPRPFDPRPHLSARLVRLLDQLARGPLGGVATASAIAWVADPDRLAAMLDWLAAHGELAALATEADFDHLVRGLAQLAVTGDRGRAAAVREAGVSSLIAALVLDAPHPQFALDRTRNIEASLLEQSFTPAPDAGRTRPKLIGWTKKLVRADAAVRQRALALWAVARIPEAFAPWQRWEHAEAAMLERAHKLTGTSFDAFDRAVHVTRVIGKLQEARKRAPEPIALGDLLLEIDMLAAERFARCHAPIVRLLAAIPAAMPVHARPRMVLHVARAAACADDGNRVDLLWDELAAQLERDPSPQTLDPWSPVLRSTGRLWLDSDLVENISRRADVARLVRVIATLAKTEQLATNYAQRAAIWLAAGLPEAVTLEVVRKLPVECPVLEHEVSRLAIALSDGTADDLITVARPLFELVDTIPHYAHNKQLVEFGEHAVKIGAAWLVRGALLGKQGSQLADTATVVAALPNKNAWPKLLSVTAGWIDRYPPALGDALRRLASVDAEAEDTAARRLGDDIPDPRALAREIEALRASGRAPKRLANLERRLAAPKAPSAKRLANLAEKIEATARDRAFTRLIREGTEVAGARVIRAFGLAGWPAWAESADRAEVARLREILFALVDLDAAADRELAGKLLRARSGPPPWDLRDEPPNAAFLARMRAANLDPAAWLDDTPVRVATAAGPIELAFTSDPLEVFAMGAHFQTCLSPDGCNFFSVVANAADINKRVLYARRPGNAASGGKVIGRCLYALTDGLALLVFQQYCHEQITFTTMVRDHATELARRIGTHVVARGPVPTLLARDWYDDGARDLVGRFAGLDAEFEFAAIPPEDLIARLREVLGRDLDDVTLPLVIGHRNLRNEPRHLAPLVPFVLASHAPQTRIDAAQLAIDNGDRTLADRLLGEHDRAIRVEDHAWPRGELAAQLRPSQTLARLRRTRPREVRSWADDRADRIALAGVALEALARPRQAAAMYRLARKSEDWLAESMKEKLEALGEPLEGEVAT